MGRGKRVVAGRSLEAVSGELEAWREGRGSPGGRVPERFWKAAVVLCGRHGAEQVAASLRLNPRTLERRLGVASEGPAGPGSGASLTFVELGAVAGPAVGSAEEACVLEFEDRRGGRLRVRLPGAKGVDVAGIAKAFWRRSR